MFNINRFVQFYETDLMGIVHHANYLRLFEEARVSWGIQKGFINPSNPDSAADFAVLSTEVRHLAPARFGDSLKIELQVKLSGVKVVFEYKMWKENTLISEARTWHVAVDRDMRAKRPNTTLKNHLLGSEPWKETWLLNL